MDEEYKCPLVEANVDETICYDIQMVINNMIKKNVLDWYGDIFDASKVTVESAAKHCPECEFNQLNGPRTKTA